MKVVLDGSEIELPARATVADALQKAGINRETVLVKRKGSLCSDIDALEESDTLETIRVISGG